MNYVILVFAVIMLITGTMILFNPRINLGLLQNNSKSLMLHILAVLVRLIIGLAILLSAQDSKFPLTFDFLGWLTIFAAIMLLLIGRNKFIHLMEWAGSLVPAYGRASGILVILFGSFLGYAVL